MEKVITDESTVTVCTLHIQSWKTLLIHFLKILWLIAYELWSAICANIRIHLMFSPRKQLRVGNANNHILWEGVEFEVRFRWQAHRTSKLLHMFDK